MALNSFNDANLTTERAFQSLTLKIRNQFPVKQTIIIMDIFRLPLVWDGKIGLYKKNFCDQDKLRGRIIHSQNGNTNVLVSVWSWSLMVETRHGDSWSVFNSGVLSADGSIFKFSPGFITTEELVVSLATVFFLELRFLAQGRARPKAPRRRRLVVVNLGTPLAASRLQWEQTHM